MNDMFSNAKAKTAPKAKKPGKSKPEIAINDLETLASIDAVVKALEALRGTVESSVKGQMHDQFVAAGMDRGSKPDSFRGVEGNASASCEIRKRSTRSVLSSADVELLTKHGVEVEVLEDVAETFVINPDYAGDGELLGKISEALSGIDGLPEDFIQHQAGVTRTVASNKTVDQVFAQKDEQVVRDLMKVVTTLAVKPKLETDDLGKAMEMLNSMLS